MSTPQTTIYICSGVRLNSKYEHSIYFANASEQRSYFAGKVVKTLSAYSYVRRSWKLKVAATMSDALTWNYLYFRNNSSDPSFFYFFINNVEYINDETVELDLELDVIQTYLFRFQLLPCFIERQHVPDDYVGNYTVDEGLDLGEYVVEECIEPADLDDMSIVAMSTFNLLLNPVDLGSVNDTSVYRPMFTINQGVGNGCGVYASKAYIRNKAGEYTYYTDNLTGVANYLRELEDVGQLDSIIAMWMFPTKLIQTPNDNTAPFEWVQGTGAYDVTIQRGANLDGYVPKNNKLFTYPYKLLYVTNNNGVGAAYRYERSDTISKIDFRMKGVCSPDGGIKAYPKNYNGIAENYDEGVALTNFPMCAWDSDPYKIWLAQNQNQNNLGMAMAGVKILAGLGTAAGSIATANPIGAVGGIGTAVSGFADIAGSLAQRADMDLQPVQAKGSYNPTVDFANVKHTVSFYKKCISREQAKIIDDFFTMFGYRINAVQRPNLCARESFTFVKTKGCHAVGNLCNSDILTIENIFNNGITFWNNGDKIGDYSQSNAGNETEQG